MIKILLGLAAATFVTACTTGAIKEHPLPRITDPDKAAEVFVIREDTVYGGAFSFFIMVDDKEVFGIKYGEYTNFSLASGKHKLGVKCYASFGIPVHDTIEVDLAPRSKNYYFLSKSFQCANIKPLQAQEGEDLVAKSTYKPF